MRPSSELWRGSGNRARAERAVEAGWSWVRLQHASLRAHGLVPDSASAWLSLQADGSLLIRSGVSDVGGGQAASLCQIASEILGVSLERISVYIGDTALTPPRVGTFATRLLLMSGNAVMQAALKLRELVAPVAAEALGRPVGGIVFEDDRVKAAGRSASGGTSEEGISLGELVRLCEARSVDPTTLYVFHPDRSVAGSYLDYMTQVI